MEDEMQRFGFIVEGRKDEVKLRSIIGGIFPIVVLGGNGFSKHMQEVVESVKNIVDVLFIATDPDDFGNMAAEKIKAQFNLPQIELNKDKCMLYNHRGVPIKCGLEHADDMYLLGLLEKNLGEYGFKI